MIKAACAVLHTNSVASSQSVSTLCRHQTRKHIILHLKFTMIGMVFTSRYVLCCLLLSTAAMVWARPPKYVYRADTREHVDVFSLGFPALGTNTDLHDHVSGVSCTNDQRQGSTAFVDTTASKHIAIKWGKSLGHQTFIIYKIRATAKFYDCKKSLQETYKEMKKGDNERYVQYQQDFDRLQHNQKRWLAYEGISKDLIKSCQPYLVQDGKAWEGIKETNPNYDRRRSTRGNPGAYIYDPDQEDVKFAFHEDDVGACVPPTWYITTVVMTAQAEPEPAKLTTSVNPSVKVLLSEQLSPEVEKVLKLVTQKAENPLLA